MVKNPPLTQKTQVQSLGREDPLEEGMATHSQYSYLEKSMDRGVCSPWGPKESDKTAHLTLPLSLYHCKCLLGCLVSVEQVMNP